MRIAIKFAYDGRKFHGFARQPKLKTIEGEILNSLLKNKLIKNIKESRFRYASRTDKNVSAFGNVIALNTDFSGNNVIKNISNDFQNIILYGYADVNSDFYPRHAKYRQYRYYLSIETLDIKKIISTAAIFTGEHNFTNFSKLESHKNPIRTIDNIIFSQENDILIIDFYAQTFLWHQIRRIISALIKIGNGKLDEKDVIKPLENPNKKVDFGLAPAEPLILKDVFYDFKFKYDKNQVRKLRQLEKRLFLTFKGSINKICKPAVKYNCSKN